MEFEMRKLLFLLILSASLALPEYIPIRPRIVGGGKASDRPRSALQGDIYYCFGPDCVVQGSMWIATYPNTWQYSTPTSMTIGADGSITSLTINDGTNGAGCVNLYGTDQTAYVAACSNNGGTALIASGPVQMPYSVLTNTSTFSTPAAGYLNLQSHSVYKTPWVIDDAGTEKELALQAGTVKMTLGTATLAEINATKVLLAGQAGVQYRLVGFNLSVAGTFATCTDVRLSDTGGSPVDIVTVPTASLTDGNRVGDATTALTYGAGYLTNLTAGNGIQIRETGLACITGTSITYKIFYTITR